MAFTFFVKEESPDSRTGGVLRSYRFYLWRVRDLQSLVLPGNAKPVRATVTNRVAPSETTKLLSTFGFYQKWQYSQLQLTNFTADLL